MFWKGYGRCEITLVCLLFLFVVVQFRNWSGAKQKLQRGEEEEVCTKLYTFCVKMKMCS